MKKIYSLLILLALALATPSALAQRTGGQFSVNGSGTTWANYPGEPPVAGTLPDPGDTISTTVDDNHGVYILNSGSFTGADGWIIETEGHTAKGIFVSNVSYFSGSNLSVSTGGRAAYGIQVNAGSELNLNTGTIVTTGGTAYGIYASGTIDGRILSVTTTGSSAHGVYTLVADSKVDLVSSTITTTNRGASGLYATMNGTISGSNLFVTTGSDNAYNAYGAYANQSSSISLVSSTIVTTSNTSYGLYANTGAIISGSNLSVITNGYNAIGAYIEGANSQISLISSTIETKGGSAHGMSYSGAGNLTATVTNSEFVLEAASSALVFAQGAGGTANVTLTNVTANLANGNGLIFDTWTTSAVTVVTTLNINNSNLSGHIKTTGVNTRTTINLADNSEITGMSIRSGNSGLAVNIENDSRWNVIAGASNLNVLENSGMLDLRTGAFLTVNLVATGSGATMIGNGNFTQTADGTLGMSLIGGGATSAKLAVGGTATLAGALDITLADPLAAVGQTFDLLSYGSVVDSFQRVLLNGANIWQNETEWDFRVFEGEMIIFGSMSYGTGSLTMTITGYEPIPEPGIWALMLGGLGMLGYLQRVRRNRK